MTPRDTPGVGEHAAQVLARLGLSPEDLRAGRVPEDQKAGYTLDPAEGSVQSSRSREDDAAPTATDAGTPASSGAAPEPSVDADLPTSAAADPAPPTDPGPVAGESAEESLARTIVLRKLAAAPQSRAMLAEALAKKDVPEAAAQKVLDRFTEVGLIDDAEYAAMLVRTRHAEKHQARFAIAQELRTRGIDKALAEAALDQIDEDDEHLAALEFARKKMRSMRGLEDEVRTRRLIAALGRRGFHAGIVHRVVDEVRARAEDDQPDGTSGWDPSLL